MMLSIETATGRVSYGREHIGRVDIHYHHGGGVCVAWNKHDELVTRVADLREAMLALFDAHHGIAS